MYIYDSYWKAPLHLVVTAFLGYTARPFNAPDRYTFLTNPPTSCFHFRVIHARWDTVPKKEFVYNQTFQFYILSYLLVYYTCFIHDIKLVFSIVTFLTLFNSILKSAQKKFRLMSKKQYHCASREHKCLMQKVILIWWKQ